MIILIKGKGNLRTNVNHEFGNLNVEAFTLTPVDILQNLGVGFDPELSFKKQIDIVDDNCNFQICNMCYEEITRSKVIACIGLPPCDI